jgi:hypothetical protein
MTGHRGTSGILRLGVAWRGEAGEVDFRAAVPARHRDRYLVGGRLRFVSTHVAPEMISVTITDRDYGATLTFVEAGQPTAVLASEMAPADVERLWRDGLDLVGWVWAQAGRPSEADERIAAIVAAAKEIGPSATRLRVAEVLGRVDMWGTERSAYKADVRRAGGWRGVRRQAGF